MNLVHSARRVATSIVFLGAVWMLIVSIRLGLWLMPIRLLRRLSRPFVDSFRADALSVYERRVIWAVEHASLAVPKATCLTQALAARVALGWGGLNSELQIGVLKSERGVFEAHAWVERQGRIVIGNRTDLAGYAVLPTLEKVIQWVH